VVFVINLGTPLVKANDPLLSFSLLFSLVVTFLCTIVYLGEPQPWSCMTSQVALALGFALCLSSLMGTLVGLALDSALNQSTQQNDGWLLSILIRWSMATLFCVFL